MNRRRFSLLCVLLALFGCEDQREWHDVAPASGRFRVSMPRRPREAVQKTQSAWGPLQVRFFEARIGDGDAVYSVTYTDYPFPEIDPGEARSLLLTAQRRTVEDVDGKLLRDQASTHRGHPSRRATIRSAAGVVYHVWVILAGSRLYQVMTASRPGTIEPADRKRFFGSFALQP